jgi:cell division protein FtsL
MKHLKRILRVCGLILFLVLAIVGMSISGIAVALNKDRKLFADEESKIEMVEERIAEISAEEKLKF